MKALFTAHLPLHACVFAFFASPRIVDLPPLHFPFCLLLLVEEWRQGQDYMYTVLVMQFSTVPVVPFFLAFY